MKNLYTYTIFDADPNASSGTAWDTHTDVELETGDDESAIDQVVGVMSGEASGLNPEDGYTAGQRLHAIVWDSDGTIVGQPTYELTHDDLGTEPEFNGRVRETGNGFPDAGDYVPSHEQLYRVVRLGRIQTGETGSGQANWRPAYLEPVEWDACSEGDEFPASAGLDDE